MTIVYIIPEYIDGLGDCTKLLTSTGEVKIIEKNIDTVMKGIMRDRLISQKDLYKKTYEITNLKRNFPLYLTNLEMLLPLKCREIKMKGDRAYGYINEKYIKSIYKGKITTLQGEEIILKERETTFLERIKVAELLKNKFQNDKYLSLLYGSNETKTTNLLKTMIKEINNYINL